MKRNGFNLIETTISLFLFSFFLVFSIPPFKNMISKLNFRSSQTLVVNSLYLARYKSALEGINYRWKAMGNLILIEKELEGKWVSERAVKLDYGVVEANNSPIFHPHGLVTNMATIHLSSKKMSSKITVAITGRIKVVEER